MSIRQLVGSRVSLGLFHACSRSNDGFNAAAMLAVVALRTPSSDALPPRVGLGEHPLADIANNPLLLRDEVDSDRVNCARKKARANKSCRSFATTVASILACVTFLFLPGLSWAQAGLVAAYTFNEGAGSTVTDVSGNGNTGTISKATWTTAGKFGNALVFNGTSAQ